MSQNKAYLDFSLISRSFYVVDIYTSKQHRLSFPRKIGARSTPCVLKYARTY
jgi:hypothetical protein